MTQAAQLRAKARQAPAWEAALDPASLGLGPEQDLPFEYQAGAVDSPLVISFPHVGLEWPQSIVPRPQVSFARNADFEVDAIYPPASSCPAARIRARFSRLLVDLNRAEDDVAAQLVPDHPAPRPRAQAGGGARTGIENRGVLWSHAVGRIPILRELNYAEFRERIDAFHRPYYQALERMLEARVHRFGYAILLDAHSMPSAVGHDLVLGTLDRSSCAPALVEAAQSALERESQLRCSIDRPYRGGEIVRRFGRPNRRIHALQLEVNRGLYMDELRLKLRLGSNHAALPARDRGKVRSGKAHAATQRLITAIAAMTEALAAAGGDLDLGELNAQ